MTPKQALKILDTSASFYESDYTTSEIGYQEAKKEREEATQTIEKVFKLLELYKQYYNKIPIGTSMYKVELEIKELEEELK